MQSLLVEEEAEGLGNSEVRIPLPLTRLQRVKIEGVPQERIDATIRRLIRKEQLYTIPTVGTFILFTVFGLLLLYISTLLVVLSLINPFLVIIVGAMVVRYIRWSYRSLKQLILKRQRLVARQLLESENRDYYYKKLIKWKVDEGENHIVIENLRLK